MEIQNYLLLKLESCKVIPLYNIYFYNSSRLYNEKVYNGRDDIEPIVITDLHYADDIAIVTEYIDQPHVILDILQEETGKIGLHCRAKKTVFKTSTE